MIDARSAVGSSTAMGLLSRGSAASHGCTSMRAAASGHPAWGPPFRASSRRRSASWSRRRRSPANFGTSAVPVVRAALRKFFAVTTLAFRRYLAEHLAVIDIFGGWMPRAQARPRTLASVAIAARPCSRSPGAGRMRDPVLWQHRFKPSERLEFCYRYCYKVRLDASDVSCEPRGHRDDDRPGVRRVGRLSRCRAMAPYEMARQSLGGNPPQHGGCAQPSEPWAADLLFIHATGHGDG